MIYSQKVEFANTIYSKYPLKNAGGDQQLTLRCISSSIGLDITRIIVSPPIAPKYSNYDSISLCLYPSYGDLQTSQEFGIEFYSITTLDEVMWSPGFSLDSYKTFGRDEGSSWNYKTFGTKWGTFGGDFLPSSIGQHTSSYRNVYSELSISSSFLDNDWGTLIKLAQETSNIGYIRYYSPNSNTIFYPKYIYYINDYSWTGSSNSIVDVDNYIVSIPDINLQYQQEQIERFYLRLIPQIYSRDWTTSYWSASTIEYALSSSISSTYCLYDVTNIEKFKVFDHNSIYTRLSCNGQKNYFDIDMQQLPRNRYYQLQLKINNKVYCLGEKFKVV